MRDGHDKAEETYCQVMIIGSGHRRWGRCDKEILFYLIKTAIATRSSEYLRASRVQVKGPVISRQPSSSTITSLVYVRSTNVDLEGLSH